MCFAFWLVLRLSPYTNIVCGRTTSLVVCCLLLCRDEIVSFTDSEVLAVFHFCPASGYLSLSFLTVRRLLESGLTDISAIVKCAQVFESHEVQQSLFTCLSR